MRTSGEPSARLVRNQSGQLFTEDSTGQHVYNRGSYSTLGQNHSHGIQRQYSQDNLKSQRPAPDQQKTSQDNVVSSRKKLNYQLSATLGGGYEAAAQKQLESFRKAQKVVSKNPLLANGSELAQNLSSVPLSLQLDHRLSRIQTQFQTHKTTSRKANSAQKSSFTGGMQRVSNKANNTTGGLVGKTTKSAQKETSSLTSKHQIALQGMISSGLQSQPNLSSQTIPASQTQGVGSVQGFSQSGAVMLQQSQSVVMNQLALKQHSNLFGGLSRHVLAAAKNNQQVPTQIHQATSSIANNLTNKTTLQHSQSANRLVLDTTNRENCLEPMKAGKNGTQQNLTNNQSGEAPQKMQSSDVGFSQLAQKISKQNQQKMLDLIPKPMQSEPNQMVAHSGSGQKISRSFIAVEMMNQEQNRLRKMESANNIQTKTYLQKLKSNDFIAPQNGSNNPSSKIQSKQLNSHFTTVLSKKQAGLLGSGSKQMTNQSYSSKKVALLNSALQKPKTAQIQHNKSNLQHETSVVTPATKQITSSLNNKNDDLHDSPKIISIGGQGLVEDFRPSVVQMEAKPKKEVMNSTTTIPSSLSLMHKIHSAPAQRYGPPPRPASQTAHPFKKVDDSATPNQINLISRPAQQNLSGARTQTFARAQLLQRKLIQNQRQQQQNLDQNQTKYDQMNKEMLLGNDDEEYIKQDYPQTQGHVATNDDKQRLEKESAKTVSNSNQQSEAHIQEQFENQNELSQRVSSSPPEGSTIRRQAELMVGAENVEHDSSERPSILEKQTPELTRPGPTMDPITNFSTLVSSSTAVKNVEQHFQTQTNLSVPPKIDQTSPSEIQIKIQEECEKFDKKSPKSEKKEILLKRTTPKTENKNIQTEQIKLEQETQTISAVLPLEQQPLPTRSTTLEKTEQADKAISVTICCHERSKQIAVLQQHVDMQDQQRAEMAEKAKLKEKQYDGIIEALKRSMEEARFVAQRSQVSSTAPSSEVDELGKLLRDSKDRENRLSEQLLDSQIEAERMQMKLQNQVQSKEDEVCEARLEIRQREQNLRQAHSMNERLREDLAMRILEALDNQAERLAEEKQSDLDQINRQHQQTLKTQSETHLNEVKQLRELLYKQERKQRDSEQQVLQLEIQLASAKQDAGVRFNDSELEEIRQENEVDFQMRSQNLQRIYEEQAKSLNQATHQIETLQLQKEAAEQGMMLLDEKVAEIESESSRLKILHRRQKDRESELVASHRVQLMRERKAADTASRKLMSQAKMESELNKRQVTINQLKAQIKQLEMDDMHSQKILLMKRKQIEDEKTQLRKKQANTVRSLTRQNLSATRLKQQLEVKEAAISTERESKRALLIEKQKLEREIKVIKRDKSYAGGDQSSRHNESMSMYFAKSQMFSPSVAQRNRDDKSRSFLAKGHQSARQIFMSQERMAACQAHLSNSQRNSESRKRRKREDGTESISNGDECESLVNIMEFGGEQSEYQTSPEYKEIDDHQQIQQQQAGRKSGCGLNPRPAKFSALDNFRSPDALVRKSMQAGMLTTRDLQQTSKPANQIDDVKNYEGQKWQIPLTARTSSQAPHHQERLFFKKAKLVKSSDKKEKEKVALAGGNTTPIKFLLKNSMGMEGKKIRVGSGNRLRNGSSGGGKGNKQGGGANSTSTLQKPVNSANNFSLNRRSEDDSDMLRLNQKPTSSPMNKQQANSESEDDEGSTKRIALISAAADDLQTFSQAATLVPKQLRSSQNCTGIIQNKQQRQQEESKQLEMAAKNVTSHFATNRVGSNKKLLLQIAAASKKAGENNTTQLLQLENLEGKSPKLISKIATTSKGAGSRFDPSQRASHDKDALVKSLIEARRKCESVRNLASSQQTTNAGLALARSTAAAKGMNSLAKQKNNWVSKEEEAIQTELRTENATTENIITHQRQNID